MSRWLERTVYCPRVVVLASVTLLACGTLVRKESVAYYCSACSTYLDGSFVELLVLEFRQDFGGIIASFKPQVHATLVSWVAVFGLGWGPKKSQGVGVVTLVASSGLDSARVAWKEILLIVRRRRFFRYPPMSCSKSAS